MPLRTDTKTLVMAALLDGPRHGYALAKAMQASLPAGHRPSGGQVYAALRGLEADGWVRIGGEGCAEDRRVYRLTDEGARELAWRTEEWHGAVDAISRLLPRPRVGLNA